MGHKNTSYKVSWPLYFEDGSNAELKENVLSKKKILTVINAPPSCEESFGATSS